MTISYNTNSVTQALKGISKDVNSEALPFNLMLDIQVLNEPSELKAPTVDVGALSSYGTVVVESYYSDYLITMSKDIVVADNSISQTSCDSIVMLNMHGVSFPSYAISDIGEYSEHIILTLLPQVRGHENLAGHVAYLSELLLQMDSVMNETCTYIAKQINNDATDYQGELFGCHQEILCAA